MKEIETNLWAISLDEENYIGQYESREEAISELQKELFLTGEEGGYVGRLIKFEFDVETFPEYGENIIEMLDEHLADEMGEGSEGWYENIGEGEIENLDKELAETIVKWINKNLLQPTSYIILDGELVAYQEQD